MVSAAPSSSAPMSTGALAPTTAVADSRWVSFHLYLSGYLDTFLVDSLLPALELERQRGTFRRFFFLRYQEGGLHLRLRFIPREGCSDALLRAVQSCAAAAAEAGFTTTDGEPPRVELHSYDRGAHYFGESLASVYAELLNEATSWFALRLLRSRGAAPQWRMHRWLTLAAIHHHLVKASTADPQACAEALQQSLDFAHGAAQRWGHSLHNSGVGDDFVVGAAPKLQQILPRVAAGLGADPQIRHIAALLRRLRDGVPAGPDVAVHALHLLYNKLGFHLGEEHAAVAALLHLYPARTRS